ncbi:Fic/DOC family protein [Chitinophaga dinghuensis]|uniref:Fic/DOC family protein n=1 Tax=Chitinophaga dinghuensis TaxID=1539050 RepID=A0A327WC45_9BACT|nr:Fic family protein [Chitinophaga dinghuensis]RAJ87422.1 Fic/DOC family protein [Chitinophaga dinghuensis]
MRKKNPEINLELEQILVTLEKFPEGASLTAIKDQSALDLKDRTFQRRLEQLKDEGIIHKSGSTKSSLYRLSKFSIKTSSEAQLQSKITISPESEHLLEMLSVPLSRRHPVGYNRDFLTSYRPNVDSYLTKSEQQKLAELGKTARLDQPAGTYAKEILQRLLIDLSWNSSRLEGNTYSLLDTQQLITRGRIPDNKSAMETQMILNHKDAIEFIVGSADEIGFNRYSIISLHAILSQYLLADPSASGRLRQFGVGISDSVFTPLGIPQQIEEMLDILLEKASQIEDPFEQTFFAMVHLPYLQPFDDVNKRVARLAANIPLNKHNLAPLAFVDVPQNLFINGMLAIYELNRIELLKDVFMWAYERSSVRYAALRQTLGEPDPFRLKYRDKIGAIVYEIITDVIPPEIAVMIINEKAQILPAEDRSRFIEAVDTELLSLHEGNFARFRVRPSEFEKWRSVWNR